MNVPELSKVIEVESMKNITEQFTRLKDHCYLDNTGAALYPQSLIKKVANDFMNNIYMNPHSDIHSLECVEGVRELILQHFNTNFSEYTVIFTSGATQALKLAIESFDFNNEYSDHNGAFVHLRDNHTSVLGLRELVKANNVDIVYISHEDFLKTVPYDNISKTNKEELPTKNPNALLIYPAQNNFNGFKYPINCMSNIKMGCLNKYLNKTSAESYNWNILLDAASFVSTNNLDLAVVKPDFVCISFYKIFGYPTGLGALLVRNKSIPLLSQRKYYGGGTIDTVLNTETFYARTKNFHEGFEDGTISFLSIMALRHCFEILNNLIPKAVNDNVMDTISYHTYYLAKDLYIRLKQLKHTNGRQAIIFYMDSDFTDINKQGGMVTFNILRADGNFVGYNEFQRKSTEHKISLRTGCFCNSGSCQRHFKLSNKEIKDRYEAGHKCGGETDLIDGVPTGAIRVSFGYYNTYPDVYKIVDMISQTYLSPSERVRDCNIPLDDIKLQSFKQISNYEENSIEYYKNLIKVNPTSTLKEILIYPIELCGPYRVTSSWYINKEGLKYNRNWKIISKTKKVLTQSHMALMSKIYPEVDLNYNNMILHMEGMEPISIPLESLPIKSPRSKIDSDKIMEYDCGDKAADWISTAVKCPNLRLVKVSTNNKTKINNINEDLHLLDSQNSIILINMPAINQLEDSILPIDKLSLAHTCRGNLIVNMPPDTLFEDWDRIIVGDHEFKCKKVTSVIIAPTPGRPNDVYYYFINKVLGHYSQNAKVFVNDKNGTSSKKYFSKDLVVAMYLRYVKSINLLSKTLVVNSHIAPLIADTERNSYKEKTEDTNLNQGARLHKDSNNNFMKRVKYFLRKQKMYEISVL